MDAATSNAATTPSGVNLPDGGGSKLLLLFVVYLSVDLSFVDPHFKLRKQMVMTDSWSFHSTSLFKKVDLANLMLSLSSIINPPKEMGYLYFFERLG